MLAEANRLRAPQAACTDPPYCRRRCKLASRPPPVLHGLTGCATLLLRDGKSVKHKRPPLMLGPVCRLLAPLVVRLAPVLLARPLRPLLLQLGEALLAHLRPRMGCAGTSGALREKCRQARPCVAALAAAAPALGIAAPPPPQPPTCVRCSSAMISSVSVRLRCLLVSRPAAQGTVQCSRSRPCTGACRSRSALPPPARAAPE